VVCEYFDQWGQSVDISHWEWSTTDFAHAEDPLFDPHESGTMRPNQFSPGHSQPARVRTALGLWVATSTVAASFIMGGGIAHAAPSPDDLDGDGL